MSTIISTVMFTSIDSHVLCLFFGEGGLHGSAEGPGRGRDGKRGQRMRKKVKTSAEKWSPEFEELQKAPAVMGIPGEVL